MELRLLVVDENPERSDVVLAGLKEAGYDVVATISKDDDLRQSIKTHQPDLIIIDLESPYRDYLENLITINRENPRPIAMFVAQEDNTLISEAIETGVSIYVADGLSPKMVKSILQIAIVQFTKFRKLQEELDKSKIGPGRPQGRGTRQGPADGPQGIDRGRGIPFPPEARHGPEQAPRRDRREHSVAGPALQRLMRQSVQALEKPQFPKIHTA